MASKDEGYNISETGNWNVASDYAKLKIMKPLYLSDEYEIIATFGTSELIEEFQVNVPIDVLKLKGFKRLIKSLLMLINNTKFAITKKADKKTMEKCKEDLEEIEKIIPALFKTKFNQITKQKQIVIKPEKYNRILNRVLEIKASINEPMNKYDLIFTTKEEFDPKKYKKKVFDSATQKG